MIKDTRGIRQVKKGGKPAKDAQGRYVWEVCASTGFDPIAKKYGRVYERVHGTLTDARRRRDELERLTLDGLDVKGGKTLFNDFAHEWLSQRMESGKLAKATTDGNRYAIGILGAHIGAVELCDITPRMIDRLYLAIKEERGISNTALKQIHITLNLIMKQALAYDLIQRNPLDRIANRPKPEKSSRRSLTLDETGQLLSDLDAFIAQAYEDHESKEARQFKAGNGFRRGYIRLVRPITCALAVRFALATGARRGEVLGMVWECVNLDEGTATIKATMSAREGYRNVTKTASSTRTIALDPATVEALQTWKDYQAAQLLKIGLRVDGSTPVFSDSKGHFIHPRNYAKWWRKFADEHGLEGIVTHELRHTQATVLLATGTDIKTVQARLGHSAASITLDMYAHALPENDRAAAESIGQVFGKASEQAKRPPKVVKIA